MPGTKEPSQISAIAMARRVASSSESETAPVCPTRWTVMERLNATSSPASTAMGFETWLANPVRSTIRR
jgi:hypothetical protein